jgi:sugar lactone lactonase YvrE
MAILLRTFALLFLLGACCDDAAATQSLPAASTSDDAFIALNGRAPADVLWDQANARLLIVDNVGNRVWLWTDKDGLAEEPYADCALPEGVSELPENVSLGQAAALDDGTLLVTRFGVPGPDAVHGGIVVIHPDGKSELVPKLDKSLHRLGVAVAADRTIYGASFSAAGGKQVGAINKVSLEKGETKVADGFGKLIGLAIVGDHLYASDQSAGVIYDAPLAELPSRADGWHRFAELPKPDQICEGPNGSLFSGQFQAAADSSEPLAVRWIARDGSVSKLKTAPDVTKPSGVNYDKAHKRLFVADSGDPAHVGVHVFAVP